MVSCFRLMIGLSALAVTTASFAGPSYTLSVLPNTGFNNVSLKAVNSSGVVIGNARDQDGNPVAIMWRPGQAPINLRELGIDAHEAVDITDSGFILAKGSSPLGLSSIRWSQSTGSVELGMTSYNPIAVNNAGMVTGDEPPSWDYAKSYLWTDSDGFQTVPHQGLPFTFARAINASGKVLFAGTSQNGFTQSYIWSPTSSTQQVANPYGVGSDPIGLNDNGFVTGTYDHSGGVRTAFVWSATGGLINLGTAGGLGSTATAINNLNQVIGQSNTATLQGVSFLWTQETGMVNLNSLLDPSATGWTIERTFALSDGGHIVGIGRLGNDYHSVLLTPNSIVPEPSSMLALAGTLGFLLRRRRKNASG